MSNDALCATSGPDTRDQSSGQNSAKVGAADTSAAEMPWMETLKGSKTRGSGRISWRSRPTTSPFSTITKPTAQADPRSELAVSKSIAVNFII